MKIKHLLLPGAALGAAALMLLPQQSDAFVTLGFSLPLGQRDLRVFNNFVDAAANNNLTPHANFPGYFGAPMAIWKGAVEWGSELHGNGQGDAHQSGGLGSGGANFDPSWQGLATAVGGINDNICSALNADGGGVLAFVESPGSNGWRMRFYENHTWNDGPSASIGGGMDIQGIATHEYGHSLGLGHTNVSGSTMQGVASGNGVQDRSIGPDDIAGVQSIYGVKSASKPRITGVTVNPNDTITITGTNFSATGNQVWFTQAGEGGTGNPVMVTGVTSSAGGTVITVTPPANAGPGDVLVRNNGTGHANLSNAWPVDIDGDGGSPGFPVISSVTPNVVPAVNVDGSIVISVAGTGFNGLTGVSVDGVALSSFPPVFTVSDTLVTFPMPEVSKLGNVTVEIQHPGGNASAQLTVIANNPPVLEIANSAPAFVFTAIPLDITMGAAPLDIMFLMASTSNAPTSLPGFFDAAIGNNFTELFLLGDHQINPITGRADLQMPIVGLPIGLNAYFQAGRLSFLVPTLPLQMTNVQQITVLF